VNLAPFVRGSIVAAAGAPMLACASLGGLTGGGSDAAADDAMAHDASHGMVGTDAARDVGTRAEAGEIPPITCVDSSSNDVTTAGSISGNQPPGAREGDLLLALLSSDDINGSAAPPSGWTRVAYEGDGVSGSQVWLYSHVVAAAEPTTNTFKVTSAADLSLIITAYRNVHPAPAQFDVAPVAQPPQTAPEDAGLVTFTSAAVSTTVANAMVLVMFFDTNGSDPTLASTGLSSCGGDDSSDFLVTGYVLQASPGPTGTFEASDMNGPGTHYITITAALEPL